MVEEEIKYVVALVLLVRTIQIPAEYNCEMLIYSIPPYRDYIPSLSAVSRTFARQKL